MLRRFGLDWSLVLALASAVGAGACVRRALAICGGLALAFALVRGRRYALLAVSLLVGGSAFVRTDVALSRHEGRRVAALAVHGLTRCEGRGRVDERAVRVGDAFFVRVVARSVTCGEPAWYGERVALALYVPTELRRGDEIAFVADLAPPHRFLEHDGGDPRPRELLSRSVLSGSSSHVERVFAGRGLAALIDSARHASRRALIRVFPSDVEALARALVLGEGDLDDEQRTALRDAGLLHLLAVSGMHLVLVVGLAAKALAALASRISWLVRRVPAVRAAALATVVLAFLYTDFAGGSGSARRAAYACAVVAVGRAAGLRAAGVRTYGLSLLAVLAVEPWFVFDLSFALSASATGGLVFLAPQLAALFRPRLGVLAGPIAQTLAAELACTPICLAIVPRVPIVTLATNLVAAPLGELVALPSCLAVAILGASPLGSLAAALATGALRVVLLVARIATHAPAFAPYPPDEVSLVALFVAVVCVASARWRELAMALAFFATREANTTLRKRVGSLDVVFLDVAQGDSALVLAPDGQTMLVDAGGLVGSRTDPGERVVLRALASLRRERVDVVVLSHPHPDHFMGLRAVLRGVRVGELWDTGQGELEGAGPAYDAILGLAREQGVLVRRPDEICNMHEWGGLTLDVLAPCPAVNSDRGPNDNSFVFRVRYGERGFLFVGDAELEEERGLPATLLAADVLKVGHHGSRTSTSAAFLGHVHPSAAIVSLGVRNRFGHPHPAVTSRLADAGIRTFRTDLDGAIRVHTDGTTLTVTTAARELTPRLVR